MIGPRKTLGDTGHPTGHPVTRPTWRMATLLAACLLSGCQGKIYSDYGVRSGEASSSLNGTAVFAEMFRAEGFDVRGRTYISPRLADFDVVVWTPNDFEPPSIAQRIGIENWLSEGERTLVFVGRDFDALPRYWSQVGEDAPADEKVEIWRQREYARSQFRQQRIEFPDEAVVRWFTFRDRPGREKVTSLQSTDESWTAGIDMSELEIEVQSYFDIPTKKEADAALKGAAASSLTEYSMKFDNSFDEIDYTEKIRQGRLPQHKVLLETDTGVPLVLEIRDPSWGRSRILAIPNGSFLLNYGLVNHEHRKLAQRLINDCPGTKVGFLETDGTDRDVHSKVEQGTMPGLAAFTTWPLGMIIVHAFLIGALLCFAWFPILGRPQTMDDTSTSNFGDHVDAIGKLLRRNGDLQHAFAALSEYQSRQGSGKTSKPESNEPPTS
jgi:hypothetical protein